MRLQCCNDALRCLIVGYGLFAPMKNPAAEDCCRLSCPLFPSPLSPSSLSAPCPCSLASSTLRTTASREGPSRWPGCTWRTTSKALSAGSGTGTASGRGAAAARSAMLQAPRGDAVHLLRGPDNTLFPCATVMQHRISVASDHGSAAHDQLWEVRAPQGSANPRNPRLAWALAAGEA